jgi:hypothetical protein
MKADEKAIQTAVRNQASSFMMAGYLRSGSQQQRSKDSDVDLFLLMKGGKPSDYYKVCTKTCSEILSRTRNVFVFASFRQQVLLSSLCLKSQPTPVHYLQYVSVRHLIVREVNTLPRFLPYSFCPIIKPKISLLDEIVRAYMDRATILHPSLIRFYYYFDILNETLALFCNHVSNKLPKEVLIREALHKLKFTAKCLSLELASERFSTSGQPPYSATRLNRVLAQLGYGDLLSLREEIAALTCTRHPVVSPQATLNLFQRMYRVFDSIEPVCDYRKG